VQGQVPDGDAGLVELVEQATQGLGGAAALTCKVSWWGSDSAVGISAAAECSTAGSVKWSWIWPASGSWALSSAGVPSAAMRP